mmetsp:Transcript_37644/g.89427  ORF Transcript_37644/g.89427 Transcript_37644/m.89427 type:complete len:456 (+) Transcript_37644:130-1497(+)
MPPCVRGCIGARNMPVSSASGILFYRSRSILLATLVDELDHPAPLLDHGHRREDGRRQEERSNRSSRWCEGRRGLQPASKEGIHLHAVGGCFEARERRVGGDPDPGAVRVELCLCRRERPRHDHLGDRHPLGGLPSAGNMREPQEASGDARQADGSQARPALSLRGLGMRRQSAYGRQRAHADADRPEQGEVESKDHRALCRLQPQQPSQPRHRAGDGPQGPNRKVRARAGPRGRRPPLVALLGFLVGEPSRGGDALAGHVRVALHDLEAGDVDGPVHHRQQHVQEQQDHDGAAWDRQPSRETKTDLHQQQGDIDRGNLEKRARHRQLLQERLGLLPDDGGPPHRRLRPRWAGQLLDGVERRRPGRRRRVVLNNPCRRHLGVPRRLRELDGLAVEELVPLCRHLGRRHLLWAPAQRLVQARRRAVHAQQQVDNLLVPAESCPVQGRHLQGAAQLA